MEGEVFEVSRYNLYIILDALNKKIKSQASVIHDEKTKIRNEKNQNMIALKNE